jgi:hypothetical protein
MNRQYVFLGDDSTTAYATLYPMLLSPDYGRVTRRLYADSWAPGSKRVNCRGRNIVECAKESVYSASVERALGGAN